jgi:hypothetical protein
MLRPGVAGSGETGPTSAILLHAVATGRAKPDVGIMTSRVSGTVTAVLGPTNTGKTHLAIERMCAHSSGIIGFPPPARARGL